MDTELTQTIYEAAGGLDGLLRLAHAWHTRVLEDEVVSHAFSHGYHPQHTERLAAYWVEALGGPPTYSERYGDAARLLRMGHHDHDVSLPRLSRRCAARFAHSEMVLERTRHDVSSQ